MNLSASTSFSTLAHHYRLAAASPQSRSSVHVGAAEVLPNVVHMNADLGRRAERGHENSGISKRDGTFPAERSSPDQWSDWLSEQTCTPLSKSKPTSLKQLIAIIQDTSARRQLLRAVGSGHSTSDITRTDRAILLNPHKITALIDVNTTILNLSSSNSSLIRIQSRILIKDLNQQLHNQGLTLTHMGAYDGQTISGAINTGTHRSGVQ